MTATAAWMGVVQDGSHVVSRVFDLGTTLLPRMGDLTPYDTSASASTTTYSAVSTGSTTSGWVNPNLTSYGTYGNYGKGQGFQGRSNPIRRKTQLTVVADYQKTGSTQFTALGLGSSTNFALQEGSGTPGNAQFVFADSVTTRTATATLSGSGRHIIGGVYAGAGSITCYAEGVAGTPVSGVADNYAVLGQLGGIGSLNYMLSTGSTGSKMSMPVNTTVGGTYIWENAEAKGTMHGLFMFDVAFTQAEMASFSQFLVNDAVALTGMSVAPLHLGLYA
jgi:hypothetical protein